MTNETAPERIWATYNDAFGINWKDGQFTTLEQPADGRYTPYVPADVLEAAQARIVELEEALERIGSAAQFYSQPGTDGMASRYAHESHARLVRAALEGKGCPTNQDSHGTDQQHESQEIGENGYDR